MSDRAFKTLFGVFLGLAALWLALVASERGQPGVPRLWARAKEARKLSLGPAGRETVLSRAADGSWVQEAPFRFPADGPAIEKFLARLAEARLSEPLAGPSRHAEFQLADAGAFGAKGWLDPAGTPGLDVLVGRQGSDFDSVFIRLRGRPEVLEARGISFYDLSRPSGAWADKLVCEVPPASVSSVELSEKGRALRLSKEGDHWLAAGRRLGEAERAARLDPLLKSLARLEAESVETGPAPKPLARLRVRYAGAQAQVLELEIGPAGPDSQHRVSRSGVPGVMYRTAGWKLQPLETLKAPARSPSRRGR